ncbi:ABC-type transport system involved in resistance to organic solvents, ATPase component [Desulfocapsa sulfexigens DSM 10523]|uniref:ABC-type transport system involved in resistance to organic solvents, ATPase component n=1 Tax=Desulfocapsa sulfexigens (strain DSM 10523 / SB164P1) TaxID=1167006 RepID=M1P6L5_DESSD|nr:ATP-binding cassette domain-containing protein [Desulfocapsa sulfexigens]AGF79093.1 ABC-type transport system involved in resistance to organic solvents, ATPase component [Desulfocapsa sulfexigens DSM 10523]
MNDISIEFKEVAKAFVRDNGSRQVILDNVSFSIPAGKTTVIAGGSGQGKSVTLKLILGLMQEDSGHIFVGGDEITGIRGGKLKELRTRFGVLFQGSALFDSMTVFENVALPLKERTNKTDSDIKKQVLSSLEQLELLGHENKFPAQLSGGMKKRAGLARALQLKPEIMLFDEPTTGLDPVMTQEIYQLFAKTQEQIGYTSVIVSHDIPKVFNLADQVIVLHNGEVEAFPSPEAIQWSSKPHIRKFVETTMGEIYQSHLVEQ